jgi:hydroxymethylpyrimidine pyrophosphatase-like HAD family hydrolase
MLGLHKVTYSVGYTSWLDIGPEGINKSTALEKVRDRLAIPRERVMALGDGRNDIDMLEWAGEFGRGIAMGQAPEEVRLAANEVTLDEADGGLPSALATLD